MTNYYEFVIGLRAIRDYEPRVISEDDLTAILEAARWTGSSKNLQNWAFVVVQDEEQLARLAECGSYTTPILAAAATIVIVEEAGGYEFDSGRVAQNIMLAAAAIGVASCPITLHRQDAAADLLGLDDGRTCHYAITLGYPTRDAAPKNKGGRKPLDDLVHWERY